MLILIRLFIRVESFIEHQDTCNTGRARPAPPPCLSRSASSQSPSSDQTIFMTPPTLLPTPSPSSAAIWPALRFPKTAGGASFLLQSDHYSPSSSSHMLRRPPNIELQLLPAEPGILSSTPSPSSDDASATKLELSIGFSKANDERAMADEARLEAKRQMELADLEFANAKRIRQQAQLELNKALALRDRAAKKIHSILLQITCLSCKQQFQSKAPAAPMLFTEDYSLTGSYISSVVTEGEGDDENHNHERDPRGSS